jgi:hypothetical protein
MLLDRQTTFLSEDGALTARLVAPGERSFMPGTDIHPGPFALVELYDPAPPSTPYGQPLRSYGDVELEALHRAFGHNRFSLPLGHGRVLAAEHVVALLTWLHAHDTERLWSRPQDRRAHPHR